MIHINKLGPRLCAGSLAVACALNTAAATFEAVVAFPDLAQEDELGVDIVSGLPSLDLLALKFGPNRELKFRSVAGGLFAGSGLDNNYRGTIEWVPADGWYSDPQRRSQYLVSMGPMTERFYKTDAGFQSVNKGGRLSEDADGYDYIASDGTRVRFKKGLWYRSWLITPATAVAVSVTNPSGPVAKINWKTESLFVNGAASSYLQSRIQSVEFSDGYLLKFEYEGNRAQASDKLTEAWLRQRRAYAINRVYEYCDPMADTCNTSLSWPTATIAWDTTKVWLPNTSKLEPNVLTVTQPSGAVTKAKTNSDAKITEIRYPGSTEYTTRFEYCGNPDKYSCYWWNGTEGSVILGRVMFGYKNGQKWTYSTAPQTLGNYVALFYSSGPNGTKRVARRITQNSGVLASVEETDGRGVSYAADDRNLPTSASAPGLAPMTATFDGRGNRISVSQTGKLPSGEEQTVTTSATFKEGCTAEDPSCNRATTYTDANGRVTRYFYSSQTGLLERQQMPAVNGVVAEVRNEYVQLQAIFLTGPGTTGFSGVSETKIARITECTTGGMTDGVCDVAGAGVVTEMDYDAAANLQLKSVKKTWNGESQLTCFSYDRFGNRTSTRNMTNVSGGCQ